MKQPRVEDFDPNAAPPLGSPLDEMPVIQAASKEQPQAPISVAAPEQPITVGTDVPASVRPNDIASVRTPVRRTITRYAFEFFQDQIETLREHSLKEKLRGEKGSMSEMVREALDLYIAQNVRTEE